MHFYIKETLLYRKYFHKYVCSFQCSATCESVIVSSSFQIIILFSLQVLRLLWEASSRTLSLRSVMRSALAKAGRDSAGLPGQPRRGLASSEASLNPRPPGPRFWLSLNPRPILCCMDSAVNWLGILNFGR